MPISQKQIDAILKLPPPKRYSHFIKKVVGWKKVWGLYSEGWALSQSPDGKLVFPLWPEKEYAQLCTLAEWRDYTPESIELEEVLDSMIPMLRERDILPGVFYVHGKGSIDVTVDLFEDDLRSELAHYE